jgi:hypothetical protein
MNRYRTIQEGYLIFSYIFMLQNPFEVMVIVEKLVEWELAGETEVLGENLPQRHSVHHKSHMTRPGFEPGPPWWEASD